MATVSVRYIVNDVDEARSTTPSLAPRDASRPHLRHALAR